MIFKSALLLLVAGVANGQQFVVDSQNGPGTDFTSLVTAAAAVPDGATLLVLPGSYPGIVDIAAKGLTILAQPGVQVVQGGLHVQQTAGHQPVVVRGLTFAGVVTQFAGAIWLHDNQGRVVLDSLTVTPSLTVAGSPRGLLATHCTQLLLRDCTIGPGALALNATNLVAENVTCHAQAAHYPSAAGAWAALVALQASGGSTMDLIACDLTGGYGDCGPFGCVPGQVPIQPNQSAVALGGCSLTVRASMLRGGAAGVQHPAVTGAGTVRIDELSTIVGGVSTPTSVDTAALPFVRSTDAALGGTVVATATAASGDFVVLVIGLPGPAVFAPGIVDPFWVDVSTHSYASLGTTPLQAHIPVPSLPQLRGFEVAWHSVALTASTQLHNSAPSFSIVF